jgi:phage shock protein PspC (stress-responsive transcriptional regulator)
MKKTIKINLSGLVFTLDEDAYQELKNYLDSISSRFRDMKEGNEIITDIESRIAEIFQSRVNDKKEVITLEDVNDVISIMGKPEDFYDAEEEEKEPETSSKRKDYTRKENRKLYRDHENAIFGGVGSGLAAYFGIEPWIIRLLLVVLTFPIQVIPIIYIVLWIVLPKALTSGQRLEMRGEKVTVSTIEKSVKEEYESVKENVKRVSQSKEFEKTKNVLGEILHVIGQILLVILKIILVIIGISFAIAGIAALIAISSLVFFKQALFPPDFWPMIHGIPFAEYFHNFTDPGTYTLFSFALFLVIAIPIVTLIYGGIKLIFRFKANDKPVGLAGLVLWLLSLITVVTIATYDGRGRGTAGQTTESDYLGPFTSDTLMVYMQKDPGIENFNDEWYYTGDEEWYTISDADKTYGKIKIDIDFTDSRKFEILVRKKSHSSFKLTGMINAENIVYRYSQNSNTLYLYPYFSLNKIHDWNSPETEVIIRVPEGKYIYLDETTKYFLDEIEGIGSGTSKEAAGKVLPFNDDK